MTAQEYQITIDALLELLFRYIMKNDNGELYTVKDMAEITGIGYSTLMAIKRGNIPNPGITSMRAIADAFGVPLSYFAARDKSEAISIIRDTQVKATPDQKRVQRWALRLAHLSEKAQKDLSQMVDWIEKAEAHHMGSLGFDEQDTEEAATVFTPQQ